MGRLGRAKEKKKKVTGTEQSTTGHHSCSLNSTPCLPDEAVPPRATAYRCQQMAVCTGPWALDISTPVEHIPRKAWSSLLSSVFSTSTSGNAGKVPRTRPFHAAKRWSSQRLFSMRDRGSKAPRLTVGTREAGIHGFEEN